MIENSDLSLLNIGDIILAKRYKTTEEKERISKGHLSGPYVIIKKDGGNVYGLQCTSNPHQEIKWHILYYPLNRIDYYIKKNTFVNCQKLYLLDYNQYIKKIGKLQESDLEGLKKYLYILKHSDFALKPDIEDKYLNFKLGVGDVISYLGNRYYIDEVNKNNYITYRLRDKLKKDYNVLINNTYYSFIFEEKEEISRKEKITLIDTFNTGEINTIRQFRIIYFNRRKEARKLKIGALIVYRAKMFYVYHEDNWHYYVYHIFDSSNFQDDMADILIRNGIYHTYFNKAVLPKRNKSFYHVKRCASEEEIIYNETLLHTSKSERIAKRKERQLNKNLDKKRSIKDFMPMVIVKNRNNNQYYLILSRNENIIELVNINDMADLFYFELEEDNCPFLYYRIEAKEKYEYYLSKVDEAKQIVKMFQVNEAKE